MPKKIIMIDPRGRVGKAGGEVIGRHIKYANTLAAELNCRDETPLQIYSISNCVKEPEIYESLRIEYIYCPPYNLFRFAKEISRLLDKLTNTQIALVSGDTWVSAITARIIQKKLCKAIPLQVQCHFDVENLYSQSKSNLLSILKLLTFKYFLRVSNQLRLVNGSNASFLIAKYPKQKGKFFIAPSILNIPPLRNQNERSTELIHIGWVGRFHHERNPSGFVELIKKLDSAGANLRVVLVGEGPLQSRTISKLKEINQSLEVVQMGQLAGDDYFTALSSIDVLVSTASAESFGRALREGVIAGCSIWSIETTGFKELRHQLRDDAVRPLFLEKNPDELLSEFQCLAKTRILQKSKELLVAEQEHNQKTLIQSWRSLLDLNKGAR